METISIPLMNITSSPQNPRRELSEESLNDLCNSIKEVGILQPILVRPVPKKKDKYEIVCGERRFNASKLLQLETIPASIRNLTDQEAFELSIIENLQRENITIVDECNAIARLYDSGKTFEEISNILGKSLAYVRLRYKVNQIYSPFLDLLKTEVVTLTEILRICTFPYDFQITAYNQFYANHNNSFWTKPSLAKLISWRNRMTCDLKTAIFDIADPNITDAGPCVGCPHNTQTDSVLFTLPEDEMKCMNSSCFFEKESVVVNRKIVEFREQHPESIAAIDSSEPCDENMLNQFRTEGDSIVDICSYINRQNMFVMPEKPSEDDLEHLDDEEKKEVMDQYEHDVQEYNELLADPSTIKAFVVNGPSKGDVVLFKEMPSLRIPSSSSTTSDSASTKTITDNIAELENKLKRNSELMFEKMYEAAWNALTDEATKFTEREEEMLDIERNAFWVAIMDLIPYMEKRALFDKYPGFASGDVTAVDEFIINRTEFLKFSRQVIINKIRTSAPIHEQLKAAMVINLVKAIEPSINSTLDEIRVKYDKKAQKLSATIEELKNPAPEPEPVEYPTEPGDVYYDEAPESDEYVPESEPFDDTPDED